ncbi:hypothetical protein GCM10009117_02700 [Gangjinia marincola]|uniref:Uncharacterized protein n=2 Tax=Gangjinia marincola TaxID=578463 RepID=A0ABP3XS06_9FLAO
MIISCNVKQTESGELPEVDIDVDAEAGNLPEYDVNWADVNVGTKTKMVKVPKVVVVMEEEEIEVPYVDVDMPNDIEGYDMEKSERSIIVEAEVSGKEHSLEIQEIRATKNNLFVISTLEELDTDLGDKTMRVQDQLELNAPDLNVKHVIVGTRPDRVFNSQHMYVSSMDKLNDKIKNAKVIYKD